MFALWAHLRPLLVDILHALDRLHLLDVRDAGLRHPDRANDVAPAGAEPYFKPIYT